MDNAILKKRLSTFRTEGGSFTKVSDELLVDILRSWESWAGSAKGFTASLGVSKGQLGGLIGKAKKLSRNGATGEFKEFKLDTLIGGVAPACRIEISWDGGKVIRFAEVDQLVDFLKKVA